MRTVFRFISSPPRWDHVTSRPYDPLFATPSQEMAALHECVRRVGPTRDRRETPYPVREQDPACRERGEDRRDEWPRARHSSHEEKQRKESKERKRKRSQPAGQ